MTTLKSLNQKCALIELDITTWTEYYQMYQNTGKAQLWQQILNADKEPI